MDVEIGRDASQRLEEIEEAEIADRETVEIDRPVRGYDGA
jgi:hypothetical protein